MSDGNIIFGKKASHQGMYTVQFCFSNARKDVKWNKSLFKNEKNFSERHTTKWENDKHKIVVGYEGIRQGYLGNFRYLGNTLFLKKG